ncbi:hypothetical protein MMC21_007809 [Puttea exsequens]|nr:hypothetical protein [Puttea exsequens]
MAETFAVIGLVSAVVAVTGMEAKLVCCLKKGKEPKDGKLQRIRKAVNATKSDKQVQDIQDVLETYKTILLLHFGGSNNERKYLDHPTLSTEEFVKLPTFQVSGFIGRESILAKVEELAKSNQS